MPLGSSLLLPVDTVNSVQTLKVSILREVERAAAVGYKEVTLLGQNVNSYRDLSTHRNTITTLPASGGIGIDLPVANGDGRYYADADVSTDPRASGKATTSEGFSTIYKPKEGGARFARCAFSDRNLHSRMPLDPTHVRFKRTCV
jgi:hypothetical protein